MPESSDNDKTYLQMAAGAMGSIFADIFKGMVAGGMTRTEALTVLIAYATGMGQSAAKPDPKAMEKGQDG